MFAGFVNLFWVPLHLVAFFVGALVCHGTLARMRPPPRDLSLFYITIALGGLLGGVWNALAAPLLFNRVVEYPLALVLACLIPLRSKAAFGSIAYGEVVAGFALRGNRVLVTVILATNQAGLAESVLGVIGVMIASGLGFLVLRDGPAQADPIRACRRRGLSWPGA